MDRMHYKYSEILRLSGSYLNGRITIINRTVIFNMYVVYMLIFVDCSNGYDVILI